jgi:hypothetical protein
MSDHVENIGVGARRRHLTLGIGALAIGLTLDAVLILEGLDLYWFAALLVPFWVGARELLQARAAISVRFVARGVGNTGPGKTPVPDAQERVWFRAQARQVEFESMLAATLLTAISLGVAVVIRSY